jgi:hypothetical protein
VRDALGCANEARAELDARCPHFEIAGNRLATADAAGDEDRHLLGDGGQHFLCASTLVDTGPIWPPASIPSITSASTPERINFLGQCQCRAKQINFAPLPLIRSIEPAGGRPPASTTWPTPWLLQMSISSLRSGCIVIRFTPNGFSVSALVAAISASNRAGVIAPHAITPKPPALDIAETRLRSLTHDMAPAMIA